MKQNILLLCLVSLLTYCTSKEEKTQIKSLYGTADRVKIEERKTFLNQKIVNPATGLVPENIHLKEAKFVAEIAESNSGLEWFSRGPNNLGGRTRALALDVKNTNRVVVGGVSGGVWIADGLDQAFQKATTAQQLHSVTCIAQDVRTGYENIWYYGTGEQNGNSSDLIGNGIYKSTDNGLTWQQLPATANDSAKSIAPSLGDFAYVKDLKVNPINGDIVVASFSGIWLSQNGGDTWTNVLVGGSNPNGFGYVNFGKQTNIDVSASGVYYATLSSDCSNKGIWRSTDGINWTNITPAGFASAYRRIESSIAPSDENQVFFIADVSTTIPLADNHQLWKYNYISGNGTNGQWTDKTANIPAGTCTGFYDFDFGYFQSQNSYDLDINIHPSDTNLIFLGGTNLYRSTDGFSTPAHDWIGGYFCDLSSPQNYVHPNHHPDNHAIVFIPNTNKMISAHDGGLSLTNNCKANNVVWQSFNEGYRTTQFYTIAIEPGNVENDFIIGGMQDNGTWMTNSKDPNQAWMNNFYGDGAYCAITEGRNNYYISWQGGKTFKAEIDDDGNLVNLTRIDPSGASNYMFINPFILDPTQNNTMYLSAGKHIWRNDSLDHIALDQDHFNSTNTGWQRIDETNTHSMFTPNSPVLRISALDMSKSSSNTLYYGTQYGQIYRLDSLDSKQYTRQSIRASTMPSSATISCIEVDNADVNKVLLTFSNYEVKSIFYTEDGGTTWADVSGNLEQFEDGSGAGPSVNWAHIYNNGTQNIYLVGTTSGLFSTNTLDGANTQWAKEGANSIGKVPIAMITSRTFDKNIVVATHGNGVYSTKEYVVGIEDVVEENKKGFYLSPIYPNPVGSKMKYNFRIDKTAQVQLSVVNSVGQTIAILEDKEIVAGTYEKRWFLPQGISKGIYRLVLQVNQEKISRTFIKK